MSKKLSLDIHVHNSSQWSDSPSPSFSIFRCKISITQQSVVLYLVWRLMWSVRFFHLFVLSCLSIFQFFVSTSTCPSNEEKIPFYLDVINKSRLMLYCHWYHFIFSHSFSVLSSFWTEGREFLGDVGLALQSAIRLKNSITQTRGKKNESSFSQNNVSSWTSCTVLPFTSLFLGRCISRCDDFTFVSCFLFFSFLWSQ